MKKKYDEDKFRKNKISLRLSDNELKEVLDNLGLENTKGLSVIIRDYLLNTKKDLK